ncbi:MAG: hypothetical protein A3I44_04455 [Candidatus Sungbacteria bacterium RIFCSPLOWO2_02_FULL_51_17]|uniref:Gfo/Idh/MocA-like oxidoreductase N-terminal domain-containing protein n=1 Tax=Candidatus Sungbacteria bacterium RIFCSPHIGHO2_02_FULL_51_29 TaxID=1802273 RepID=A0A1G2KT79_9BACT|nr:MAG: hypothetical protein A2676_02945 [Candidatus Sungbacteria bacterium RIFCSPHIGHO2_01_FULL_51_22]OHA01589.1 MAG: hypothetical protein A3C16_00420 [Candidatus Sungbacteria bacterium RIFCSPHIGHO2_02_FULL_51_29]OHA04690.1 MAG: hypothetical protein A3B29_01925 [Candidatus Sungbacteria bacterium RIFCSPLOWO2_01_FULL_51_34]OHA12164.1 MAG: hypothetical protein A3I44_04455 [Candidatus Sungbacteria bacterium RIFCSPLOWO2_02_FULL_51_17]
MELETQAKNISLFLSARALKPEETVFIPDTAVNRTGGALDGEARRALDALIEKERIDGIIISTEPKAHKVYAEWAFHHGIHVLMDKPITAPLHPSTDMRAARRIYEDYRDLENARKKGGARCYVTCQRRNHAGYTFIKKYLKDFVSHMEIPISYIDVYHADGAWNLPHEFQKENHPYKYGYGKLMHSGYHFVDLFAWIASINNCILRARPEMASVYTTRFAPNDLFHQIDEAASARLFDRPELWNFWRTYRPNEYEAFGELDAYVLIQLMREKNVITTGSINLQQNSFSKRGWYDLPEDTYKGNGRIRHERVNIQVSQFLNIQVHSYQSSEKGTDTREPGSIGSDDHFDVLIFRNKKIIGGEDFVKYSIGEEMRSRNRMDPYYLGHNEQARETTMINFIEGNDDESELPHHKFTNQLLSTMYASIAQRATTGAAEITCTL